METLRQHEVFELGVLDELKRARFLNFLVFGGGTMLRLCHELPRFSVDLDFWFSMKVDTQKFYKKMLDFLTSRYKITDAKNKHYTLLYEIRDPLFERKLKIEIRKEVIKAGVESKIAYSSGANKQVLVNALTLEESAKRKLSAMHGRHEIRDFFDFEFLLRKGAIIPLEKKEKDFLAKKIRAFKKTDYSVALGALLEKDLRDHYIRGGFSRLLEVLGVGADV